MPNEMCPIDARRTGGGAAKLREDKGKARRAD